MYKILVSAMPYDGGKSGISVYINETLAKLSVKHQLTVLILESDLEKFPVRNDNITFKVFSDSLASALKNMLWHLFVLPRKLKFSDYDFIFLPAGNRRLFYKYPIFSVVTLHDLSQYHIKGKYDMFRMFYIKKVIPFFIKRADHIMNVSGSTFDDAVKYYHIPEEIMSVNYNGYNADLYNSQKISGEGVLGKYDIKGKFILYISRIEHPGKNHLNLVKAYEQLPESLKKNYSLILGGSFWPGSEVVEMYIKESPDRDRIKCIGFVPTEDLPMLYRAADCYVFPSFFEGFGLSLLEAMACGTPVVCSNRSSLPEIGGDAVRLFNPDSPEDIAEQVQMVIEEPLVAEEMIKKGFKRVSLFDWQIHADKIVEIYEKRKTKRD
jgi:glycosyltransferase involved in cell wall biosynthesis